METALPLYLEANYHTHTPRCHHAHGSEREYIEAAIGAGIKRLGFSDHAPYTFPGGYISDFRMTPEDAADYTAVLSALKEEYKNEIEIFIGYEMEYYPEVFPEAIRTICSLPVDYLILGQHFLFNEYERRTKDCYSGSATQDAGVLSRYVDQVIAGVRTGAFSYIAHPDLIHFTGDPVIYEEQITRLCREALRMDIPLELNLYGLHDRRFYPVPRFFEIAKRLGCRLILGCDAHEVFMLNSPEVRQEARDFLDEHGLSFSQKLVLRDPHRYIL